MLINDWLERNVGHDRRLHFVSHMDCGIVVHNYQAREEAERGVRSVF